MTYFFQGSSRYAYSLLGIFIFCVIFGVGYSAYRERQTQLTFQLHRAQGSALVVEDQLTQTFQLIESMALTLPELSDKPMDKTRSADLIRLLHGLQLGQPAVRSLSVMTMREGIKASTNSANFGTVVSLDDFFPLDTHASVVPVLRVGSLREGRDFADGGGIVGEEGMNGKSRRFLPLAFRLGGSSDAAWLLVAINTDYLLDRIERYTQGESDEFALVRFDGRVLMHSNTSQLSEIFDLKNILPEVHQREIGAHNGEQLIAYRASSRYPFFFIIRINRDVILGQWQANSLSVLYWTSAALLIIVIVTILLIRQVHVNEETVRKQQIELTHSRDKAQAATLAKSQFLATMSHEIRTPMNGVLGMTELLANSNLTDEQRQLLRVLQSSGRTLLTLIDDILDFSKIEMGKLELESIPIDVEGFFSDLKDTFTIQAQARGLELIFMPREKLPAVFMGDPTRLRQVFSNLLSNAIKFTHQGRIRVTVTPSVLVDEYEVSVQDTGIGIGKDVQDQLFNAFTQANSSITRQYGGSGLGLVISAMLIKMMGGRIWLESELGRGSTFRFTFKAVSTPGGVIKNKSDYVPTENIEDLQVLLVEDHEINRLVISKILNHMNIFPDVACDGLEVLDVLKNKNYDVVLMDLHMPNMDGLTAAEYIRKNENIRQPYIIALTANAFAEDKVKCYAAGMNDFISKPVSIDELAAALSRVKKGGVGCSVTELH